jgi:radical SAM superfamily enzyme YgiQ (UPF0313 family)
MRVLLINTNLKDDVLAAPPIGLCYVASAADAAGHSVRVLDLCFRRRVRKQVEQAIVSFSPEVIGLSLRNLDNVNLLRCVSYLPEAADIVALIRQITGIPVVVGGSGASLNPEGIMAHLKADFIVVSDGEESFVSLLESLGNGRKTPEPIPGVGMIHDGEFRLSPAILRDFKVGRPHVGRWIDMRPYEKMGSSYAIQTKRGCPERCIYCTYNQVLEGNRLRLRPPVDVVDELEESLFRYKPEAFEFVDSVFNSPVDHCMEILEEILRRPWKARFTAMGVNPRNLDTRFLNLMWRAGFRSFMISPESASETMIQNYRKGFHRPDLLLAAEAISETRFTVMWYFLIGGPGETNHTLQESLDFVRKHLKGHRRPPYHMANYFLGVRAYPKTELWERAHQEGFFGQGVDLLQPVWYISEGLDLDEAVKQMTEAAADAPEIVLGFDERYLRLSKAISILGKLARMPKPYWRHAWGLNQILLKSGLRFMGMPPNAASVVRRQLAAQGYRGPLLHRAS